MWRYELIQWFIDKYRYKKYLEIGLGKECENFKRININFKIGIDPYKPSNIDKLISDNTKYYELSSNTYLEQWGPSDLKGLDIAFIDGLHEYKQVIHEVDVLLKYLNPRGVILIHDCNPFTKDMAKPLCQVENYSQEMESWMGDVWKSIPLLRKKYLDYSVFVYDTDCGIGIVTKRYVKGLQKKIFDDEEIINMSYEQFVLNKKTLLDLISINKM